MDIYNIFTSKIPASMMEFDPRQKKLITFLNPHSYKLAFNAPELFEKFDWIAPDGILIVLILNLFKATAFKIKRFSCDMTSVAPFVFDIAVKNQLSVYFLGADEESITDTVKTFKKEYPLLPIAGYRNGYFDTYANRWSAIDNIVSLNPDIVFVGMGVILQETMALNLRSRGYSGAIYTCGGFLHQSKHEINFYPNFINRLNLRFIYRSYKEGGFFSRSMKTYPAFCYLMVRRIVKQTFNLKYKS
ncbi:WecB/TagA/CpsF family glycosyltransferase [Mucilaginibacter ginsenosidivorax]|uniref:WecB/TagA/CpsF family glycosyltransferase n=1 Tax=Mucilaginibacter ginsenosidivorax TaxID=862126 RepID=A0A5B8W6Y5_9SPHI|nr:WecB/TagA/CpsF family glycosyltransferase [Mucilaginibacter ginsenosidivorax]QEC78695.1 WecB/TagA/CpsF family glycosyltransferase [Mucilaginibacter ginsenosidivorax]